ncbi:MAG: protein phosphatase 2C domain-containing protein [Bacteroidales bacterium]|nr:protein phosphatase 2C domain-containing protein [Bacteroidales bacterium]
MTQSMFFKEISEGAIFKYCVGESHLAEDKECQDRCYAETNKNFSIAILSDGHGSDSHFRSARGANFAVEITKACVAEFLKMIPRSIYSEKETPTPFSNQPFTAYYAKTATDLQTHSNAHKAMMNLVSAIVGKWNLAVQEDALKNDLTDWEKTHVPQEELDKFLKRREKENASFAKAYGCTLMAYVQTKTYWFAFHIGDGKAVFLNHAEGALVFEKSIPWDDECVLNVTTSLCDKNAVEDFRYCYQGDGTFPVAVFMASDGMDDSYGENELLYNFYAELYKNIIRYGKTETEEQLETLLPQISKNHSRDDMSVALVYNSKQNSIYEQLYEFQKSIVYKYIVELQSEKEQVSAKIELLNSKENKTQLDEINIAFYSKKIETIQSDIQKEQERINALDNDFLDFSNKEQ